jgi:hypothetical protein
MSLLTVLALVILTNLHSTSDLQNLILYVNVIGGGTVGGA